MERQVPRRRPRFIRGDFALVGAIASRIAGSADLYQAADRLPTNSVNFVTAHDGFTLNDLVSYNSKHNEANGEGNRDGADDNSSWNHGVEGETDDPRSRFRNRSVKNYAAILLVSQGVPMILRRRGAADAARQQQHVLPGQRALVVRLDAPDRHATCSASSRS